MRENLAWRDGIKAYLDNQSRKSNPHQMGDVALEGQWSAGWDFAAIILNRKFGEVAYA